MLHSALPPTARKGDRPVTSARHADVSSRRRRLRRVLPAGAAALVRATYSGRPGHPVLIGRDHWAPVAATAGGDSGAREYLLARGVVECECGDLATGRDVDRPEDLPPR